MFVYKTIKIKTDCNQQRMFQVRPQYFSEAATGGVLQKDFLKNFATFTGKHLSCESFFYKVTGLQPSGLQHRCFLVNNAKFLRTPILKNICEPLPLLFSS